MSLKRVLPRAKMEMLLRRATRCGRATPRARALSPACAASTIDSPHTASPWLQFVRGMRDYPVKLLVRNNKIQTKSLEVEKEWSLGMELKPSEVKSLRARNADLSAAFGEFYKNELFLHQMYIPVWRNGLIGRPEPMRERKLLAHKAELKKMQTFLQDPLAQLLPLRVEVGNTGWIKVVMAQCYKKNKVDNRKRDDERDVKRQLRDW